MNERLFSKCFLVRKLNEGDIDLIFGLAKNNKLYYEHCPPMVTKQLVLEEMYALPPNVNSDRKYYVGFFKDNILIAVMDLIDDYHEQGIAFIGLFMTNTKYQNQGIGSTIINELTEYLKSLNYRAIRLAWVKGNPQAEHFWTKNGFVFMKETTSNAAPVVILAEKRL